MAELVTHTGGCHCGAVRFQVRAPAILNASTCNCSICVMSIMPHIIVSDDRFTITQGEDQLTTYRYNTMVAQHTFCKICGVKSFYVPRSNPTRYSVAVPCLDKGTVEKVNLEHFDGQNWEESMVKNPTFGQDG